MEASEKTLLTVIGEASLESEFEKAISEAGGAGYTISDVRGRGHSGERAGEFEQTGNIKVEILCGAKTADALMAKIRDKFFRNYAVILFTSRVSVFRSEKFL